MDIAHNVTVRVLCYGPPPAVGRMRSLFLGLLEREDGPLVAERRAELVHALPAHEAAARLAADLLEPQPAPPPAAPGDHGLSMLLPELAERAVDAELGALEVLDPCSCICTWDSSRDGLRHQVGWIGGERLATARAT